MYLVIENETNDKLYINKDLIKCIELAKIYKSLGYSVSIINFD